MTNPQKIKDHGSRSEKIKEERSRQYVQRSQQCMVAMHKDFQKAQREHVPQWAFKTGNAISSTLRKVQVAFRRFCPPIKLVSASFRALDSLVMTNYGASVWYGIMMLMILIGIAPLSVLFFVASVVRDLCDFLFLSPLIWGGHQLMMLGLKVRIGKTDRSGYENWQKITYFGKLVCDKTYKI